MSKPHAFVAIYIGDTVASARLIAASANDALVRAVAEHLLDASTITAKTDPAPDPMEQGRCHVLRLIVAGEEDSK